MKKKNEIVPYQDKKMIPVLRKKLNYKKLIIPGLIIIGITVIIFFIASLLNPSNKAKSYLEKNGYTCNKQTCSKDLDDVIYNFNFKKLSYYVETESYHVNISQENPTLTLKEDEYVCYFTKEDYKPFTEVDNTFIYNKNCDKHVKNVNKHIREYKKIITESNINVNS